MRSNRLTRLPNEMANDKLTGKANIRHRQGELLSARNKKVVEEFANLARCWMLVVGCSTGRCKRGSNFGGSKRPKAYNRAKFAWKRTSEVASKSELHKRNCSKTNCEFVASELGRLRSCGAVACKVRLSFARFCFAKSSLAVCSLRANFCSTGSCT